MYSSMRLGVSFIAPKQLGAVKCIPGRHFLPSVAWRTGHCPVPDFLPKMAQPTVVDLGAVGAPDMSGAHRTVWCPLSDRWLGHVSRAETAADRWP